eukprot:344549-Chlamydomonas_euryale.AAC.2
MERTVLCNGLNLWGLADVKQLCHTRLSLCGCTCLDATHDNNSIGTVTLPPKDSSDAGASTCAAV